MPVRQRVFPQKWAPFLRSEYAGLTSSCMAQPISTEQQMPGSFGRRLGPAIASGGAGLGVIILLAALALWLHYWPPVFLAVVSSGIPACFSSPNREFRDR